MKKRIEKLQHFEQIVSTSIDMVAFFDDKHRFLAVNSTYAEYFGLSADEIIGKHAAEVIGEERYNRFSAFNDTIFLTAKPISLTTWIEYPHRGRRFMEVNLTPYVESDGKVTGLVSRSIDITEKHERDARLRLSAKVFENALEGIIVTDTAGAILTVNQAFCDITGYAEAEVLGGNPRLLKSGRHDDTFYADMWHSLAHDGKWRGEIWNRNKLGEVYPELLTISAISDFTGEVTNYVAVFSDISALKQVADQLEHQAHHHPLTGLPNRLLLYARLEHSIQQVTRNGGRGAVMFLDLDNFKTINDSLGHSAGDDVLVEVANRLQEHSREVDTVSHLSGDEFVIVLQAIGTIQDAVTRAEQILDSFKKPYIVGDYELYVSGSIGITEFSGAGDNIEVILKNADAAMYKAKENGKNCYQLYRPEFTEKAIERVLFEGNLRRAVKNIS